MEGTVLIAAFLYPTFASKSVFSGLHRRPEAIFNREQALTT
jgi:hypothetical protein